MTNLSNTLCEINNLKKCMNSSLKSISDHFYMYLLDILLDSKDMIWCVTYGTKRDVRDTLRDFFGFKPCLHTGVGYL